MVMDTCPEPTPRYSVIVPVHNSARTIEPCLEALLDQSLPKETYEILIVDDGSTDNTAELVERYPVRLLKQAHAGPASARNLGATAALGEFLIFTDADCLPIRIWLEEIVRPLEKDGQVAGAQGSYQTEQTNLIARFTQVELEVKYAALRRKAYIDFLDTASAALRREAFWEEGGFDPSFSEASNEDTQLSFSLASKGRRLVFAEKAVVYHRHPESLRRYLSRKWRHGFWRTRVYRQHPEKMTGDSYTPRSTQVQLLAAALTLVLVLVPDLQWLSLAAAFLFLLATLPFVRQALPAGLGIVVVTPPILFLRALALGTGLVVGALTLPFATHTGPGAQSEQDPAATGNHEIHKD